MSSEFSRTRGTQLFLACAQAARGDAVCVASAGGEFVDLLRRQGVEHTLLRAGISGELDGWTPLTALRATEAVPTRLPTVGDDVHRLMYTSGTTGRPKGVMITHANVLTNLRYLQTAFVYDGDSTAVTWMPHYHDYGLVEGLLQPLYSGIPSYVISPLAVLKRPLRWLQAISRHRGTWSGGVWISSTCARRRTSTAGAFHGRATDCEVSPRHFADRLGPN